MRRLHALALAAALPVAALLAATLPAADAAAAVQTKTVTWQEGGVTLEGYLAWDDAVAGPRPGVMVVHQWMGLTENEMMRARMLAELGYVALATDVYGQGVRPADTAAAAKEAGKYYGDRALLRARSEPSGRARSRWPSWLRSAARP